MNTQTAKQGLELIWNSDQPLEDKVKVSLEWLAARHDAVEKGHDILVEELNNRNWWEVKEFTSK